MHAAALSALSALPGTVQPVATDAVPAPAAADGAASFAALMEMARMPAGAPDEDTAPADPAAQAAMAIPPPPGLPPPALAPAGTTLPVVAAAPAPGGTQPAASLAEGREPAPPTSAAAAHAPAPAQPGVAPGLDGMARDRESVEPAPVQAAPPPARAEPAAPLAGPPSPPPAAGSAPAMPAVATPPVILAGHDPAAPLAPGSVPFVLAARIAEGERRIEIRLDPQELGRVEVSVTIERETSRVVIAVERPEAYAALAREQKALERALAEAGLGTAETSLAFTGGGRSGGHLPREDQAAPPAGAETIRLAGQARLAPEPTRPRGSTGLDLTV